MDAEGLGRKLAADPPATPRKTPEKQTVGTVRASHKTLTLQAHASSLNTGTAKAEEMVLGDLRQSVPQNGRVHLHITEYTPPPWHTSSVCRPNPRSQSKEKLWCIPSSWENKGKEYTP